MIAVHCIVVVSTVLVREYGGLSYPAIPRTGTINYISIPLPAWDVDLEISNSGAATVCLRVRSVDNSVQVPFIRFHHDSF